MVIQARQPRPFFHFQSRNPSTAYATKEAIWPKHFTSKVLHINDDPITIYCDNMATIKVVKSQEMAFNARTKHLDLRKNAVHDYIEKNIINVEYVPTKEQRVDILTKVLDAQRNKHLMSQLGLYRV